MDKTPETAGELIPQAIKRLAELYEKHEEDISDDHANMLYWQIVGLCGDVEQAAGIPYDGPPLGGTYTREDKLMDDWARDDFARK